MAPLRQRVANLFRQSRTRQRLVVEAVIALAFARISVQRHGQYGAIGLIGERVVTVEDDQRESAPVTKDLGWAVEAAAKSVPWNSLCLTQAIAVARMLNDRELPWVLHVGLDHDDANALLAHAWVTSGRRVVVGGAGISAFTRLTAYAPRG